MHRVDRTAFFADLALDAGDRTVGFGLFPFLRIDAANRDQMRSTDQFKDVLRTFNHTLVTAGTEVIIDDRQTIGAHLDCPERTDPRTGALHHAAEIAGFRSQEIGQSRMTILDPFVLVEHAGMIESALAKELRHLALFVGRDFRPHDAGNLFVEGSSARRTGTRLGRPRDHRFGKSGTTRKTASAAVGAGHDLH